MLIVAIACLLTLHVRKTNCSVAKPENPLDVVTTACNIESLEFNIQSVLGCGTYSKVWLTTYKGKRAAVKTFTSSATTLWQNEKNFYLQNCIKHGNILQFLAAEEEEYNGEHKLYLITDYCEFGSLMEYLTSYKLEWKDIIVLVSGLAAGVAHLHSDRLSNGCIKCAIAHQDIKSSNVLVNGKRECVIADFGFAVPIVVKENLCAMSGGQVRIQSCSQGGETQEKIGKRFICQEFEDSYPSAQSLFLKYGRSEIFLHIMSTIAWKKIIVFF